MFIFSGVFILVWGQPHIYKLLFCSIQKRGSSVVQGTLTRIPPEVSLWSLHVGFVEDETVCVRFSRRYTRFPLPQISFHHFSTLISFTLFLFISSAPVVLRHAWTADTLCYSQTFNIGASLHLIPRTGPCVGYELRKVFVQECSPMGKFRSKIFAYG